jgi:hypothetical protein
MLAFSYLRHKLNFLSGSFGFLVEGRDTTSLAHIKYKCFLTQGTRLEWLTTKQVAFDSARQIYLRLPQIGTGSIRAMKHGVYVTNLKMNPQQRHLPCKIYWYRRSWPIMPKHVFICNKEENVHNRGST